MADTKNQMAVEAMDLLISTVNATGGVRASISRRVDGMLVIGHCSHPGGGSPRSRPLRFIGVTVGYFAHSLLESKK